MCFRRISELTSLTIEWKCGGGGGVGSRMPWTDRIVAAFASFFFQMQFLANNLNRCFSWIMQVATISSMGAWITVMWNVHNLNTDFSPRLFFFPI